MRSAKDEEELNEYTKAELINMYLQLKKDYADKSYLLYKTVEDLKIMSDIALMYIDERAKMRKEIAELKGNK